MGYGLLLHGAVDDDPLQVGLLHRANIHRRFDRGLQQFFDSRLAQVFPEPADQAGVAGQAVLVINLAAEELE